MLSTEFKDFESANTKALEFELMNFKTVIVPIKNSYFIELEKLESLEDANSLMNTLTSSNIKAKIVKSSTKFLLPQKKLKEEIKKISMLSEKQEKPEKDVVTKKEVPKIDKTVNKKDNTAPVQKKPITSLATESKKIETKKEEIKPASVKKVKKTVAAKSQKPSYLKPVVEKVEQVDKKPRMTIDEPKGVYYSLQAGAYSERFGADRLAAFLRNHSELPVFVKKINGLYKVFAGTFRNPDIAKKYLYKLSFPKFDNENISFFMAKIKN